MKKIRGKNREFQSSIIEKRKGRKSVFLINYLLIDTTCFLKNSKIII